MSIKCKLGFHSWYVMLGDITYMNGIKDSVTIEQCVDCAGHKSDREIINEARKVYESV